MSYKLVGNQEVDIIDSNIYSSVVWFFNDAFKRMYLRQYLNLRVDYKYENKVGVPVVIMYLSPEYNEKLTYILTVMAANKKDITGMVNNALGWLSFGAGGIGRSSIAKESIKVLAGYIGLALSVIALILAYTPKPVIERLRDEVARNPDTFIKVVLFDVIINQEADRDNYNIQKFKVKKYPEYENKKINIYGEKYLLGGFELLKNIGNSYNAKIKKEIDKVFKEIEENYGEKKEIKSTNSKKKAENTKEIEGQKINNGNKITDNKTKANNTKSVDNKTKTDNTKSTDNRTKANNTKSVDNKTKNNNTKSTDNKAKANNTKSANNTKDSKNETKNTKSKNNKKQAKK